MSYRGEPYDKNFFGGNYPQGYSDYTWESNRVQARADDIESYRSVDGQDVLVVGCAFGYLVNELVNRGANVSGMDISSYAIQQAQSLFPTLTFIEADFLTYNFKPNRLDLIVCINVIDVLIDKNQALDWFGQARKAIRNSGWMYCLVGERNLFYLILSEQDYIYARDLKFQGKTVEISNVRHLPIASDRRVVYY